MITVTLPTLDTTVNGTGGALNSDKQSQEIAVPEERLAGSISIYRLVLDYKGNVLQCTRNNRSESPWLDLIKV